MTEGEAAAPARTPTRLRLAVRWAIVALALVAGLIVIDTGVRLVLQWRVAVAVEEALPPGVTANVDARVHGFSAVWQLARGSLDHLELSTDDLTVLGVALEARVDGYGVSFGDGPVPLLQAEQMTGRLHIGQDALNQLVPVPGASGGVTLGDDIVSYATTLSVFGLELDVGIEATVAMQGDRLIIQATRLELVGGPVDLDAGELLAGASIAVPICTSEYLPSGIHLRGIDVSPDGVTLSLAANQLALDEASLNSQGTCR